MIYVPEYGWNYEGDNYITVCETLEDALEAFNSNCGDREYRLSTPCSHDHHRICAWEFNEPRATTVWDVAWVNGKWIACERRFRS